MPDYSLIEVFNSILDKELSNVHTSLVARVEKVNEKTIDVLPVTKKVLNGSIIDWEVFKDVPPIFLQGGGSYEAMPIAVGDYCLLFVTEDCTDRWYGGDDNLEPNEDRRFDYSDCFALVGVNPLNKAISIPSVWNSKGDRDIEGNWTHTGNINLTGNLTVTGDIILNGVSVDDFIKTHTHGGVQTGGSNTAPPNPL